MCKLCIHYIVILHHCNWAALRCAALWTVRVWHHVLCSWCWLTVKSARRTSDSTQSNKHKHEVHLVSSLRTSHSHTPPSFIGGLSRRRRRRRPSEISRTKEWRARGLAAKAKSRLLQVWKSIFKIEVSVRVLLPTYLTQKQSKNILNLWNHTFFFGTDTYNFLKSYVHQNSQDDNNLYAKLQS